MATAKELSLYYLRSKNIGEMLEEVKNLDLTLPTDSFLERYKRDKSNTSEPKLLPPEIAKEYLNVLIPILGNPISYELILPRGYDYASQKPKTEKSRVVIWKTKDMQQMLLCCDLLDKSILNTNSYTDRKTIRIYVREDCFIQVLLKSDNPAYWKQENARRYKMLAERRKIGQVTKRLDRE